MPDYTASLTNHTTENYLKHGDFVFSDKHASPILNMLNPQPGEAIVDLGAGTGQLTEKIKLAVGVSGRVVGIDSSEDMLKHAAINSGKLDVAYFKGDIQDHTTLDPSLEGKFDAVFSSATFHWCKRDPGGVVETMKWLLKPGGRAVFEFGGFGNVTGVRGALHEVVRRHGGNPIESDPWYFPTAEQYSKLLIKHGLQPVQVDLVPRPTALSTDMVGWLKTFARNSFMMAFNQTEADKMMDEVSEMTRPDAFWCDSAPGAGILADSPCAEACPSGWEIMYVRLRGIAVKST
ncbi:hypothetical protein CcaverHIS002_0302500 [Cutaneotrichosporon cavernicola]|uniref:Methyltransferase type 11 domain-containing protein n=1 Tax=Cutaneotrichosporon cavernicola TaxID=279322 RepID=A0AA48I5T4_9TREE|nr:uncharacterized protein CcaverHIS019_0302490 [Cutaneotrichosporon cavernicola]BEI82382.1 hypothetical protein CcaverHIS002_0302500 [Cutaneotrichosporon cavernicola]BEI90179.1 hypothetical protein CcaverHIS019_0302490 [Cutaneotrichosporon cavernicola]BEI97958.1 hypothetical protein CcaverHIS631_0302570 [Cutaneotrichosporon cavernicola]BEJ05734.1 hypothetical protein CcaverHIS641_0302560 [Cutaneotrichosporon cavernicola]